MIGDDFPRNSVITDYAAFRPSIRNGDVLLCSGSGSFSKLIQSATGSDWSHVGFVYFWEEMGRVMVLESVETMGVRTVPLSKYLLDYDNDGNPYPGGLVMTRHNGLGNGVDMQRLGQTAADRLSYAYDNQEIARIGWRVARSAFAKPVPDETIEHDETDICSELVHRCYRAIGIEIRSSGHGFIAPADFARDPAFGLTAVLKGK